MKFFSMIIVSLILTNSAFAQGVEPNKVSIHLGLESMQAKATSNASLKSHTNVMYGVEAEFHIYNRSYFKTGLLIHQRSHTWTETTISGEYDATYLSLPLHYSHKLVDQINVFAGLRLSKKMQEKSTCYANGIPCPGSQFESLIYGGEIGANYQPFKNFLMQASYFHGLSKLTKDSDLKGGLIVSGAYLF